MKLRLDYFLSVGGKVATGDLVSVPFCEILEVENDKHANIFNEPGEGDCERFIISFAPRKNTGKQPVPDRFPVLWSQRNNTRKNIGLGLDWEQLIMDSWKPDIDALIKLQDWQDKTIPTFSTTLNKERANFKSGTEVITGPSKIAECFERDQEADDLVKHEDEIEQLGHVASKLRSAGFFVQIDALLFMQQAGLLNDLTEVK